jgi:hypothetical protein
VFGSTQADAFKSHTHTANVYNAAGGAYGFKQEGLNAFAGTATTNATGGTETRPRNIALLACVKT